ncbi:TadE/TadG family type IV pilus assembly protein [Lentzea sp. BCCO 10_0798]|uniref:TadE/TadG family type IV pilus assembly protein n=1 Tax=Lentzea kristufekii TaxID=3095430 RepID=A0ABU4U0I0_9PSEU|nr:TadE/TadG family type IV pilus assembly protein [Lentzea sp. BCCO 10_0798]MDX8053789.1 TadE/TadG family type IV pilus assembly protein [Lentzea sp. BCCO 10_0798]
MTAPVRDSHGCWKRRSRRLGVWHRRFLQPILQDDRGSASANLVLFTPLLLLVLLTIVQFVLWSHATHIAQAAASQGLAVTRAQNGTAAAGTASARQLLDQLARGPLTGASVAAERSTASASVRITGTARAVVPFLQLPVHAEALGPVERFVTEVNGFASP